MDQAAVTAPDFVHLNEHKRDQFLSQRGNFTPAERALFHQLCNMWESLIPYQRFLRMASGDGGDVRHTLKSLVEKLYRGRIAVTITETNEDGESAPAAIALTNENSSRFYYLAVDEYFRHSERDPDAPLPFADVLRKDDLRIPEAFLTDIASSDTASILADHAEGDQGRIYRVSVSSGKQLIVTSGKVRSFIALAMQKLRHMLSNANILTAISREVDSSLTALRKEITGKDSRFWYSLSEAILSARSRLEAQRNVPVTEEFFCSAEILHAFITGQLSAINRQREAEQERRERIEGILAKLAKRDEPTIPKHELRQLIEGYRAEYEEDFERFRNDFFDMALKPPPRRQLSILLELDDEFIHRDRLYPLFLDKLETLRLHYGSLYLKLMRQHIRGGRSHSVEAFYSYDSLLGDLERRLKDDDPRFLQMYESPDIMGEALVHWARQKQYVKDTESLRKLLLRHFAPGAGARFYDLAVLFDLHLERLFEDAFRTLSPIRQIVYRLFGRYEAMRERYGQESRKASVAPAGWARGTERVDEGSPPADRASGRPPSGSRRVAAGKGRPGKERVSRPRQRRGPDSATRETPAAKTRIYTREESDEAWEEFKRHIRK